MNGNQFTKACVDCVEFAGALEDSGIAYEWIEVPVQASQLDGDPVCARCESVRYADVHNARTDLEDESVLH